VSLSYFAKLNAGTEELWVTDGTPAGTHMIKALGPNSINHDLMMIGARVYFSVDDGVHGSELWTSDGTAAGTMLLKDINPFGSSTPLNLTDVDGTLFFQAFDPTHGAELWKTDGTTAGTTLVADINPSGSSTPQNLAAFDGALFFQAAEPGHGAELWKSDPTTGATALVADINPGAGDSFPTGLTVVNNTLFFEAFDPSHGTELWKSDGTAAGTMLVADIDPGTTGSFPFRLTNVNGTLFFEANDGIHGDELWKSDGTAAGTVMVKDIKPGSLGSGTTFMRNVNGTLFFDADDGIHGDELWKSDGTAAGTVMVADIRSGAGGSFPSSLTSVGGTLFFSADDGIHGSQIWKSDGTPSGTVMLTNLPGGQANLVNVNGVLEFEAFDGSSLGLFRSDGTVAGTVEIATHVDALATIGATTPAMPNDSNGDGLSDILWRNSSGALAGWTMFGGAIESSGLLTSNGAAVTPGASWNVAAISDFTGDGTADALWRNSDGLLTVWSMNGSTILSSGVVNMGGVAVTPGASWSVAGAGDFDGDSRSDILWRNSDGTLAVWTMNGSSIMSSNAVTSGGTAVTPDANWSVAGIGDFNGDGKKDILWRNNTTGEVSVWNMNGSAITSSADLTSGGAAIRPDSSWSVAGIGDFNADGNSDILWRNSNGSLAVWLMNGSTITSSATVTFGGAAIAPNASWHVVEIGDFSGDGSTDILWRNDSGAMAEWLMNGATVVASVTPSSGGAAVMPDSTWTTQAKPTNFA